MKALYLGLDPSRYRGHRDVVHLPLIQTLPRPLPDDFTHHADRSTHLILTSRESARYLLPHTLIHSLDVLAIGEGTRQAAEKLGARVIAVAVPETQEGMVALVQRMEWHDPYVMYGHSSRARPLLRQYLAECPWPSYTFDLYDTVDRCPDYLPPLSQFDEIVFTSSSTVTAFIRLYGEFPTHAQLTCIGDITAELLAKTKIDIVISKGAMHAQVTPPSL